MRVYARSRFRFILLLVLLASASVLVSTSSAQDATTAAPPAGGTRMNLFSILMQNRDFVSGTILVLSIAAVTLIIQGFIRNRMSVFMPVAVTNRIREMIGQRQFKELIEFTDADPSFISKALNPALKRAPVYLRMKEAMETAVGEQTAEQFRRIEYLNIIGNLGPLLGLLGTVLGMIDAFSEMFNNAGGANPQQLAGGVSKALAHTFLGLLLAVPCLAAFGVLRTMVDRLTVRGAMEAEDLLLMIKPQESQQTAAGMSAPGAFAMPPRATPQPGAVMPPPPRRPTVLPEPAEG